MSIYDRALTGKVEVTKGTDIVPTATDAIRVNSFNVTVNSNVLDNTVVKQTAGNLAHDMGTQSMTLEVEFKLRFSGSAGVVGELEPIFHCCGTTDTIVGGISVTWDPIHVDSAGGSSFYAYKDGLLYKFIGAVGNMTQSYTIGGYVICTATISAPFLAPAAVTAVTPTYSDAGNPLIFTTAATVDDGSSVKVGSFELDYGNNIAEHEVTGEHVFEISNRAPTITLTKDSVSTAAEWTALTAGTDVTFALGVGSVAGNTLALSAGAGRRTNIGYSEREQRDTLELTYNLYETSGDDQFSMAIT